MKIQNDVLQRIIKREKGVDSDDGSMLRMITRALFPGIIIGMDFFNLLTVVTTYTLPVLDKIYTSSLVGEISIEPFLKCNGYEWLDDDGNWDALFTTKFIEYRP